MKLKTLKDLMNEWKKHKDLGLEYDDQEIELNAYEIRDNLKQEAIRWIKELSEPDHEFIKDHSLNINGINFVNYEELEKIKGWIKHFFNITDKELK